MAKTLVPAPDIKERVDLLIERYPNNLGHIQTDRILFWRDIGERKRKELAYVKKVDEMDKMVNPNYDFHFVANETTIRSANFSPSQEDILWFHEALHIAENKIDNNGNEVVKLNDHDMKEFYVVVATFGVDWQHNDTVRGPLDAEEPVLLAMKPVTQGEDGIESEDHEDPQFV